MNTYRISIIVLAVALLFPVTSHAIYPGESIDFDPFTGDYMINYMGWSEDGTPRMQHVRFVPATKIEPIVKSSLALGRDGAITYGYSITSGANSRQPLVLMIFDPVSTILTNRPLPKSWEEISHDEKRIREISIAGAAALLTPVGWDGDIYPSHVGGHRIGWSYHGVTADEGLQPGQSQKGFGFASPDLPGLGIAELSGAVLAIGFPDEGPDGEISDQHMKLLDNDFVAHNAAIPTIAVPTPFDPAVTLERIQAHMHTWIAKQLIAPAFSSQLDSHFQATINAYRNQGQAGNGQIGKMLALLVQQYEELERGDEELVKKKSAVPAQIDKLAALVLYFDLKYVMRRAGGN